MVLKDLTVHTNDIFTAFTKVGYRKYVSVIKFDALWVTKRERVISNQEGVVLCRIQKLSLQVVQV
ncbi:hypothetical protein SAMN05661091_0170 [Paenibacillus uliginis N3/975]|uniref:Uncharacterized protein n=1 Tax=Paenibacillus uliginis N3/975 TaxID=1313296 RepID=A0A1X7G7S8_9BACL|nr:hypothetical protein SAMN05661091_0170 [Paenibacillus uliginis N3/975]